MKKQNLKLSLRKRSVSNLYNLKGGGPQWIDSLSQLGDFMCCDVIEPPVTGTDCRTIALTTCGLNCEYKKTFADCM
ncbi:MAG: hypothetical protein AAF617_16635 [Bacteroidota bacterium]